MIREDDMRETLDQAASDIAEIQSNPRAWLSWMIYLLERLGGEATKGGSADKDSFLEMLSVMQDAIRNRARTRGSRCNPASPPIRIHSQTCSS